MHAWYQQENDARDGSPTPDESDSSSATYTSSEGSDEDDCDSQTDNFPGVNCDNDEQSDDSNAEVKDDEQLKDTWRSQKYVPGTRKRYAEDFAKMKSWINGDQDRKDKFLPIKIPFSHEICIQYLHFEMRRKINHKGDLMAPGTLYQVIQMLKYEGEVTVNIQQLQTNL